MAVGSLGRGRALPEDSFQIGELPLEHHGDLLFESQDDFFGEGGRGDPLFEAVEALREGCDFLRKLGPADLVV